MKFEFNTKNGKCKARAEGELTIYVANMFKEKIQQCVKESKSVELDLSKVEEIDTSCFQLLMQMKKHCEKADVKFVLTSISPLVQDVLHLYNLEQFFESNVTHTYQ